MELQVWEAKEIMGSKVIKNDNISVENLKYKLELLKRSNQVRKLTFIFENVRVTKGEQFFLLIQIIM